MSEEIDSTDRKTLLAKRKYHVPARIVEQHEESPFFPSPTAHIIWHIECWLFPAEAGKFDVEKMSEDELRKLPAGYRYVDTSINRQYSRDLAKHILNRFHPTTQEELIASKFAEASGYKKVLEGIKKSE